MDFDDREKTPATITEYLSSAKESLRVLVWTWRFLESPEQVKWLRRMFSYMSANILTQMTIPFTISLIFRGLAEKSREYVAVGIAVTFALMAIQKLFHFKQATYRELILGYLQGTLDDYITRMMFEKSLGQHAEHSGTLNVGNIDKGRWKLLDLQGLLLFEGFQVLSTLLVAYILIWVVSPVSGLAISLSFVVYITWTLFLNHKVVLECTNIDKRFRVLNRRRLDRWSKVERVKTSGMSTRELREMSVEFADNLKDDRRFWLWFIKHNAFRDTATMLAFMTVISYGTWQVWQGHMNIGNLYPIFMWTSTIVSSVWQIGRIEHMINWNMPAVKAKIEALSIPPEATDAEGCVEILQDAPIAIEFQDVSYTYPEHGPTLDSTDEEENPHALQRVSFAVDAGQKVAIIGQSGAGKSTLARLLLRSMDPSNGKILVNGIDMRQVNSASWIRTLGYIPQQAQIFDGSIRYNLTYALSDEEKQKMGDPEIWSLMRDLQIDFGKRLTNGIYTEVGTNGIKLSASLSFSGLATS
ncbi:MAG: ABC transporter related protein [Parcubacteria group bacterium GW2011_GWB1_40_5]|nr:MAG: ABC transporter related protein [Parcubacteria group bacterium GW2011_GWB1_40_5]